MSAHAGGVCMSQCAHWRIPLFFTRDNVGSYALYYPVKNAGNSPHLHQKERPTPFGWVSPFGMCEGELNSVRTRRGVCMSRCTHWRTPWFFTRNSVGSYALYYPVKNAGNSPLSKYETNALRRWDGSVIMRMLSQDNDI